MSERVTKVKPFREDIIAKITGRAMYAGDFIMSGMLYAKILWPKHPTAKIIRIDITKAEKLPGVERIITRKDITGSNLAGTAEPYDRPVLVGEGEEVNFLSDALAIIVATREEIATEALEHIDVDYKILPGIYSLEDAINVSKPFHNIEIKKGNVEEAFANANVIVEDEYHIPYIEHAYLEPEGGYVHVDELGVINICYASQNIMRHQRMICKSLGIPYSKVRISVPFMGGGFGGKHAFSIQAYLALVGYLLKRPVRLVWTREESMVYGGRRHCIKGKAKLALSKDGKITAIKSTLNTPAGPYRGQIDRTLNGVVRALLGVYWIENMDLVGNAYKTNYSLATAFRGMGATEGAHIIETLIEKAAKKLNMSSVDIRMKNLLKEDQVAINYPGSLWELVSERITIKETLEKVFKEAGSKPKSKEGKKVGRGISIAMPMFGWGHMPGGYKGTAVDMKLFYDGSINVRIGFPEAGQGITGVVTTLVSNYFGIPKDKISVNYPDTHVGPKTGSLGASQGTVNVGNAILTAASNLKNKLEKEAQIYLLTHENVDYRIGKFYIGDKECLGQQEFLDHCYLNDINMNVTGYFTGRFSTLNKWGVTFTSGLVDIQIDEKTGEIEILQIVSCHDAGKVIYKTGAIGQMVGGAIMAMGAAMYEEFKYENGMILTPSFTEYIIPTANDIPDKNIALFVECPGKDCPYGAKGLGEHGLFTFPPALVNAVRDAIGVCPSILPITPERILKVLNKI